MQQLEQIRSAYCSFLDNKVATWKKQHKLIILFAVVIIPLVLYGFLYWSPKNTEIKKLRKDNEFLKGEIEKVEALAGKLDEHKAEKARVGLQLKAASLLLPKKKEIPSLLTNISEQGTSSGLEFVTFQPRPERAEQFYSVIPVAIKVTGSYHKIGSFLDKVSKLNRIVTVNNIDLQNPKQTEGETMLDASLELVTYRFLSISEQEAKAATKDNGKKGKKKRR